MTSVRVRPHGCDGYDGTGGVFDQLTSGAWDMGFSLLSHSPVRLSEWDVSWLFAFGTDPELGDVKPPLSVMSATDGPTGHTAERNADPFNRPGKFTRWNER